MKILFLSQSYPGPGAPVRGTFNLELCRALAAEHEVRVIAPCSWTERLADRWRGEGSRAVSIEGPPASYPTYWYVPRVWQHCSDWWMTRSIAPAVRETLCDFDPDVVLSYWAHPEGACGLDLARRLGVPAVCIVGGSDVLLLPKSNPRRRAEVQRVVSESDAIMTVSEGLRRVVVELGADPENVHTIYQGVDEAMFHAGDRRAARDRLELPATLPIYVWVGRMVDVKRVDLLIDAVALLQQEGVSLRLFLLGGGPLEEALRRKVAELQLSRAITFVGPVTHDRLADWYRAADAMVLSSRSEGLPNVLRESLSCGTPFVSTGVGSIREIADPAYSLVVDDPRPETFAQAMREILHPDYREGAANYQTRSWTDCARDLSRLMGSLRTMSTACPVPLPCPATSNS